MLSQSEFYHKSAPLKSDEKNEKYSASELGDLKQIDTLIKTKSHNEKGISSVEVETGLDTMIDKREELKNKQLNLEYISIPSGIIDLKNTSWASNDSSNRGYYCKRYTKYDKDYFVNYIYMTEVSKILFSDDVFIIIKENKEVIKFLRDEKRDSKLRSLAKICEQNCYDMLKKRIEIHEVSTITDEINHITQNFNQGMNYSSAIYIEEAFYLDSFNNIRKV